MTKKLKRPLAFLSAFVMVMALLLYFPSGTFSNIDWGIKASAATITLSKPKEGDGSSGNPYRIGTAEELYWFAACVNGTDDVTQNTAANAVLTANIVVNKGVLDENGVPVSDTSNLARWTPIGSNEAYSGTFDGQGHTVSGLYLSYVSLHYIGFFSNVGTGGSISNVGVVDSYFTSVYVGGVCARNDGEITNCYNSSTCTAMQTVGGVCEENGSNGKIENCYNTGKLNSNYSSDYALGVCGDNKGVIENCYFLEDTATNGILSGTGEATSKTAAEFSNGTVCGLVRFHSLQNDFTCALCGGYEPAVLNNGTYEISNAGQLYWFADQVNGGNVSLNAVLTANIVVNKGVLDVNGDLVSDTSNFALWTPIGQGATYSGTFDGQNHTISGLYFNDENTKLNVGLFGYRAGTIKNVGVIDSYFKGNQYVGGVSGSNLGAIINCYNTGTVIGSGSVGGVCGSSMSTITNCYNTGTVISTAHNSTYVGGVCGNNGNHGTIQSCYNKGTVSGPMYVGGVCGKNSDKYSSVITNCYNTGTVKVTANNAGGVCGSNDGTITNCYNTGAVNKQTMYVQSVGGVCGSNSSTITNCYYLADSETDTFDGTTFKNTAQFVSGEVAYLLQGEQTEAVWGQNLADTGKQDYPVLGGAKVYQNKTYAGCADMPGDPTYSYSNTEVAPIYADHALTATPENKPTCTETGNKAYWTCSKCNKIFSKEDGTETFESIEATVISATGHNLQKVEANAPTCEEAGNKAYWTCSTCGKMFSDENGTNEITDVPVIEKTGHSFTEEKVKEQALKDAATCTSKAVYYKSCSKCDAISKDENDVFESGETLAHDYSESGVCKNCDALENGNDGFKSASVTLTDGVILNYYVLLSEEAKADTNAYIHFTSDKGLDTKIMLSKGVLDNGRYKFSLELRPDQMAEEITAKVVYSDNSEGSSVTYSVKQYAESVGDADNNSINLANAMLRFGAYTQLYTGKNTDNLATSVEDYTENASIADTYNYQLDSNASGITVNAATLQIGAYTTIRVKYQLDEGADITKYTFKCDNAAVEAEQNGNYCYVYFRNIRPENLGDMHSFTVSDGTNTTTFKYSAFSYMKNVLDNANYQDKKIVNLINAMYDYYEAATEYMKSN